MSASKKKMQRRETESTEKLDQLQAEQTAYKKKVRLYTVIGIVIVVLVAALLIWNSGLFQKNATAATIGDTEISVSELSYYYYNNYDRFLYSYYYGISDDDILSEEEGTTYRDHYLESALATAHEVQVLYEEALANGWSDADVKEDVDAEIESMKASAASEGYSYKSYLKASLGRYMTPSTFKTVITRYLIASQYSNEVYNKQLDSYTAEDLEAYYTEHKDDVDTFTYSYLYFTADSVETTGEDGEKLTEDEIAALEEAAMAAAKEKADATLESYNNKVSVADLIEAGSPTSSADHTTVVGSSSISSTYREQLLDLGVDEGAVVENEGKGYYVVIFHGRERSEVLSANVRHILFSADPVTDSEGKITAAPSEEDMAAAKAEAEAVLAEFKAGEKTPEAFGTLANEHSDDAGSNTNGGLYENVLEGDFVTEFNDWMFGDEQPNPGDTAVIRHDGDTSSSSAYWGYHVTYLESWGEAEWQLDVRATMADEATTALIDSLCEANPAELANGAKHIGG